MTNALLPLTQADLRRHRRLGAALRALGTLAVAAALATLPAGCKKKEDAVEAVKPTKPPVMKRTARSTVETPTAGLAQEATPSRAGRAPMQPAPVPSTAPEAATPAEAAAAAEPAAAGAGPAAPVAGAVPTAPPLPTQPQPPVLGGAPLAPSQPDPAGREAQAAPAGRAGERAPAQPTIAEAETPPNAPEPMPEAPAVERPGAMDPQAGEPPLDITGYLSAVDVSRVLGDKAKLRRGDLPGTLPSPVYNATYFQPEKGDHFGLAVQVWRDSNLAESRTRFNTMRNTYSDVAPTNKVTDQGFRAFFGGVVSLVFADPRRPLVVAVNCSTKVCTADQLIEIANRVNERLR